MAEQVPSRPVWLQLTHGPVQALLQQTPSAQKFEAHCEAAVQSAPIGFGPQVPFAHLMPLAQSASDAQVPKHALVFPSQLNGAQMITGPDAQVP